MSGDYGIVTIVIANVETVATTTETIGDATHSVSITETNGVIIEQVWISPASDPAGRQVRSLLGAKGYEDLGNLAAGASIQLSFEMLAEENISEGIYFPKVHIDLKNDANGNYEDVVFPINIGINNAALELIPKQIPSTISLSGATDITFTLMNVREAPVDNVVITPHAAAGISILPEKMVVHQIPAGGSHDISFALIPQTLGIKDLLFDIKYLNGDNSHTDSLGITIETVNGLDVAPIIYAMPATIEYGTTEEIRLKVYNAKAVDISSVIVTPITSARVIPSQYFIGSMDADDIYALSFKIDTTGLVQNKSYDIGFIVSFKQDDTTYETPLIQSSFMVVPDGANGDETAMAIGVSIVLALVIIYFTYRWRKKQRIKRLMAQQSS